MHTCLLTGFRETSDQETGLLRIKWWRVGADILDSVQKKSSGLTRMSAVEGVEMSLEEAVRSADSASASSSVANAGPLATGSS